MKDVRRGSGGGVRERLRERVRVWWYVKDGMVACSSNYVEVFGMSKISVWNGMV